MRKALSLVGAGILAGALGAQTGAAPGRIAADTDNKCLSISAFDNATNPPIYLQTNPPPSRKWIVQIKTVDLLNDSPGNYTTALTVYGVDTIYGNTSQLGTQDFLIVGKHNRESCTFTPEFLPDPSSPANKIATAFKMNSTSGGNFGLMIAAGSGTAAVADWNSGPRYAERPSINFAFHPTAAITGISQTFVDPEIVCHGAGNYWLYWVAPDPSNSSLNLIVCQPIDVSSYNKGAGSVSLSGSATIVARPVQSSSTLTVNVHSPTIITDENPAGAETRGMLLSERVGNDSDEFWLGTVSPTSITAGTHKGPFVNNTQWTNNGGVAGGRIYYANSGANGGFYAAIHQYDGAWLVGDVTKVGTSGSFIGAVKDQNAGPNVTVLYLSTGEGPSLSIPGINGQFGLNIGFLLNLGAMVHTDASERASFPVAAPNDTNLIGKYAIQGLSIDSKTGGADLTFTNTADWYITN